jgi:hypothetical protein
MLKFVIFIFIAQFIQISLSLKCYSCSTLAGDRYCTEDSFDGQRLSIITCPLDNDICVRLIQRNHKNIPSAVMRSCGKSNTKLSEDISDHGFFASSGTCLTYRGSSRNSLSNSTVTLCSCSKDLGNGKNTEIC